MTYVVTENCIKCKYTDCVEVCPVDCFHEGPNFLAIDPDECIDCALCEPECPAEAIFAEIHARFPDLVEEAQRARVWLVSPTTLMAVLTTARAVLRDVATQEQVHVIREHLHGLSKDFGRFQERMDRLSTHIARAHRDVEDVHKSASRISGRFRRIEEVDLDENAATLPGPDTTAPEPGQASR